MRTSGKIHTVGRRLLGGGCGVGRHEARLQPAAACERACEFEVLGIQFVSLHEGVDTSTPNGRLVFGIFASIAEFERELIREPVRCGLAVARARGKRLGRPPSRVGADKAAELRAQDASRSEIAARLGVGIGTVHRVAQGRSNNHSLAAPVSG